MAYSRRSKKEHIPTIHQVTPLPDYRLKVEFTSGSELLLNMADYLGSMRYCPLENIEVFNSVTTDGDKLIFDTRPPFELEIQSDAAIHLALDIPPLLEMRIRNEREQQENAV